MQDFSVDHLRAALDQSLRRLGTEDVDVYQLHGPGAADPALVDALRELALTGKVRRIGVGAEDVTSAASWAHTSGDDGSAAVDVIQLPFGPLDPEAATEVFPAAADHRIELWVRGVFGGGVFGLLREQPSSLSPADRAKATAVTEIADELGLDLFALAVAFVRSFDDASTIVLGTSSIDHLQHNVELVRCAEPLPDDIVRRIAGVVAASNAEHAPVPVAEGDLRGGS